MTTFTQWVPSWYSDDPDIVRGSFKEIMTSDLVMKFKRRPDFKHFFRHGRRLFVALADETWLVVGTFGEDFDIALTDLPEMEIE